MLGLLTKATSAKSAWLECFASSKLWLTSGEIGPSSTHRPSSVKAGADINWGHSSEGGVSPDLCPAPPISLPQFRQVHLTTLRNRAAALTMGTSQGFFNSLSNNRKVFFLLTAGHVKSPGV